MSQWHAAQFQKGRFVMQDCILFKWTNGWDVFVVAWLSSIVVSLAHWYRYKRPEKFVKNWPKGTDKSSVPAWVVYCYACVSQLSPVGMISRLIDAPYSRFVLDTYILGWGFFNLHLEILKKRPACTTRGPIY